MKSRIINPIYAFVLFTCLSLISSRMMAQPREELSRFQQKYPENFMVNELEQKDITIEMKNGGPLIRLNEYSSRFILQNNSTAISDYKYYFDQTFQLKKIHAYSLVPDGNKYIKMPVKDFVKTAESDDGVFYDDGAAYVFNFSSIGKGTKLVVESETEIRDISLPVSFYFNRHVPTEKARISVSFPSNVKILYRLFGGPDTASIKFFTSRQGNKTIYTWEGSDLKAFNADKLAPDPRYFVPHLFIQVAGYEANGQFIPIMGSVEDLYRYCYQKLKDSLFSGGYEIKKLGDSLTSGLTMAEDKVNAIYSWVQNHIRYIAIEDGENGVVPSNPELVLKRRYGDCKGKTSILVSLLRSQGLKASFAWVGSRSIPYMISDFPSRSCFNHMVAVWWNSNEEPVILDGTTEYQAMYEIPANIQGKECLIEKGPDDFSVYKIPVAPPSSNTCLDSLYMTIDSGILEGKGISRFKGERRENLLHSFNRVDTNYFRNIIIKEIAWASNKIIIHSVHISNPSDKRKPFQADYTFSIPDYINSGKDRIYVNMNLDRFPGPLPIEEDRTMPVESEQTFDNVFTCTLRIPDGYTPGNLPEDISFSDPEFGFIQHYRCQNSTLTLTTRIYFAFQIISGDKIKRFSEMISSLQRAYSKSILLIKK